MWDFLIVLGEVPGTDYEITFSQIVGFCLFAGIVWTVRKRSLIAHPRRNIHQLWLQQRFKKGQQLKLPV